MKKLLSTLAALLAGLLTVSGQTIPLYENYGAVNYRLDDAILAPPVIDAQAFANYGEFQITNIIDFDTVGGLFDLVFPVAMSLPYEFNNVDYFTNRGTMKALFGFRFDHGDDLGNRPAANFVNGPGAVVDAGGFVLDEPDQGLFVNVFGIPIVANSYLLVSATNVVNRGVLQSDNQGLIRLKGNHVDLRHGGIRIKPAQDLYESIFNNILCFFGGTTYRDYANFSYQPDVGISDVYWGYTSNKFFGAGNIYFPFGADFVAVTPPHDITGLDPVFFTVINNQFLLLNPLTFGYSVVLNPTNIFVQAVFVSNADTNIFADVRFAPSTILTNPFTSPVIEFSSIEPDIVTGLSFTNHIYFMDQLAAETNSFLLTNLYTSQLFPTQMPTNYAVSRTIMCEYLTGTFANTLVEPDLFSNPSFNYGVLSNNLFGTAYSWNATNVSITLAGGNSVTNAVGRIEIEADTLDLERARFRGEGYISIKANHLLSSEDTLIDGDRIGLVLGSTNGTLAVRNVANEVTRRMAGNVFAWSGVWPSSFNVTETNEVEEPPGSGNLTNVVTTNEVFVNFHVLMVDNQMQTRFPVIVNELTTFSTNVSLDDRIHVPEKLSIDAERLTITGALTILDPLHDIRGVNIPNLAYFTNLGTITITNAGFFGSDRPRPLTQFVNHGSLIGVSHSVRSDYFENSGVITAQHVTLGAGGQEIIVSGPIVIEANDAKIDGGRFETIRDILLAGGDFKFRSHQLTAGALRMNITNSLSDNGPGASNVLRVRDGFHLHRRPAGGDLLGTTLHSATPSFSGVDHVWPAVDLGAVPAGYTNNLAVGRLILEPATGSLLSFSGASVGNAIYVDFLELRGSALTDLENTLTINQNLVIYFADCTGSAEDLDGQLADSLKPEGRLRWVRDFAGPNSSVDVALSDGTVIRVNRALRNSLTIDSDGDGVANGFDFYPFDGTQWTSVSVVTVSGSPAVVLSFLAAPQTTYQIESTADLTNPDWQPLTTVSNLAVTNGVLTFTDTQVPAGVGQRFYRVRYDP